MFKLQILYTEYVKYDTTQILQYAPQGHFEKPSFKKYIKWRFGNNGLSILADSFDMSLNEFARKVKEYNEIYELQNHRHSYYFSDRYFITPKKEKKTIQIYSYTSGLEYREYLYLIEFKKLKNKTIYLIVDKFIYDFNDSPEYEIGKEIEIDDWDRPSNKVAVKIESTELWKNIIYRSFIKNKFNY